MNKGKMKTGLTVSDLGHSVTWPCSVPTARVEIRVK